MVFFMILETIANPEKKYNAFSGCKSPNAPVNLHMSLLALPYIHAGFCGVSLYKMNGGCDLYYH